MVAKKTSGGSSLSKTIGRKAAKKVSRKKKSRSTNKVYEVECILDHVRFKDARREYFDNKDQRFKSIFTTRHKTNDEYYFLIKWRNWEKKDATWESETNFLSLDLLSDYKKRHGLPEKCVKIRQGDSKVNKFKKGAKASSSKPKSSRKEKSMLASEESVHEVEYIIDHVTVEYAFQQFFEIGNEKYESIFTIWDNKKQQDRHYFLIKWTKFPLAQATWESETSCGKMAILEKYKELHGLPKECVKIQGDFNIQNIGNGKQANHQKPQSSTQISCNTAGSYEVERILGHITFENAYREYFVNKNQRYGGIFADWNKENQIDHDKYYFSVKWKNFSSKDVTWESETDCTSITFLEAYKKINGMDKKHIRVRGKPCSTVPGKLIIEEYESETQRDENNSKQKDYGFYPSHQNYNKVYGMVRSGDFKYLKKSRYSKRVAISTVINKQQKFLLVKRIMKSVKKNDPYEVNSQDFEVWQQKMQIEEDRSFLSSLIQHPNSVKMLDYYFNYEMTRYERNTVYCYVYEHFEEDLAKKICSRTMTVQKSKKMCTDMLSILSLLHQYGAHAEISKNSIYVDGDVYKLSNYEQFRFAVSFQLDIRALGQVLLESLTNEAIGNDRNTLEESIESMLAKLSDLDRWMVSMMMYNGYYIDERNIPEYRFSAKSLLEHPWLDNKNNYQHVKCVLLASYRSQPIEEFLFYQDDDIVQTVLGRLRRLYSNSESMEYQMLFLKDFDIRKSVVNYIGNAERFVDILKEFEGLKLVVVPILKAEYTEPPKYQAISFAFMPQEFGAVPVVIESAPMCEKDVCRTVIEHAFSEQDRRQPFIVQRWIPDHGRLTNEYDMWPKSLIDKNLEHTFPKLMDSDDCAIPAHAPQYCITERFYNGLNKEQPETMLNVKYWLTGEFYIRSENVTGAEKCRFALFDEEIEQLEDVSEQ